MSDDMRLAKLSVLLNSAVRMHTANQDTKKEAYSKTIKLLKKSMLQLSNESRCKNHPKTKEKVSTNPENIILEEKSKIESSFDKDKPKTETKILEDHQSPHKSKETIKVKRKMK